MVDKNSFTLWKMIRSFLSIAVLGFGGGAAVIPLFHKQFVDKYKWITDDEFQDILSVSNALPGPIQTKISGYIGYKLKGLIGLILALLSIILPSLLVMLVFYSTINYYKDELWVSAAITSVFPVVTVLMLLLTISFFKKASKKLEIKNNILLLILSILSIVVLNVNPALLIIVILLSVFLPLKKDIYRFLFVFVVMGLLYTVLYFQSISASYDPGADLANANDLVKVVYAFFVPGVLGYGGGPGSLSLISYEVVDHVQLLTQDQFALVVAIQAALPGVTATKLAGTIGYQIAGFLGLFLSILVYVTPSMILMITLLHLLNKYKTSPLVIRLTSYIGPVVVVLLGQLTYNFFISALTALGWILTIIFIAVNTFLLTKLKIHPFFAIILSMVAGVFLTLI